VDVVAEISEVEVVVEVVVEDAADSTMTVEGTEIVIQDGVTGVVVRAVIVDEVLHNAVPDQSHLEVPVLLLQPVDIDPLLVVLLPLLIAVLVLVLVLLYHQPTGDCLHHVGQVHHVDMLHVLLLVLHYLTVGGHGHRLLPLLVTESVVSKTLGEAEAHLRPDVVGFLQDPPPVPTADPIPLPASTLDGGVEALLQEKEAQALVDDDEGVLHDHLDAEVQVLTGKDLENMGDD